MASQQTSNPSAQNVAELEKQEKDASDKVSKSEADLQDTNSNSRLFPKLPSVASLLGFDNSVSNDGESGSLLPKIGKLFDKNFSGEVNQLWDQVFNSPSTGDTNQ